MDLTSLPCKSSEIFHQVIDRNQNNHSTCCICGQHEYTLYRERAAFWQWVAVLGLAHTALCFTFMTTAGRGDRYSPKDMRCHITSCSAIKLCWSFIKAGIAGRLVGNQFV